MTPYYYTVSEWDTLGIEKLKQLAESDDVQAIMVLAADGNERNHSLFDSLEPLSTPVFGGVFPQLIFELENHSTGFLLVSIESENHIQVIQNVSDPKINLISEIDEEPIEKEMQTMFVFVDGFASRIGEFIEALFSTYGLDFNFVGGGAGSLSMVQKPCIFTPNGLLEDAAILVSIKNKCGVGVQHGWKDLAGPFKVTQSNKNTIQILDNKPAFDIYKEVVEKDSGLSFAKNDFFSIAKAYPFGISKLGAEKIVRDPIILNEDGSLTCVGEVNQNSFVHILKGDKQNLIEASSFAVVQAQERLEDDLNGNTFFIDCISRVLFLEDSFKEELKAVKTANKVLFGALTLGEVANNGSDYLEFYNKTAVVARFSEL